MQLKVNNIYLKEISASFDFEFNFVFELILPEKLVKIV